MTNFQQSLYATKVARLAKSLDRLGIDVPESMTQELAISEALRIDDAKRGAELAKFRNALVDARTPEDLLSARDGLASALSVDTEVAKAVDEANSRRAYSVLWDNADYIQTELSTKFNEVVSDLDLNHHARNLPDFADKFLSPLSITGDQHKAMEAWRSGAPKLNEIFDIYTSVVVGTLGQELGNTTDLWSNLVLAYVLGDVQDHGDAVEAAQFFPKWLLKVDGVRAYRELMPFVGLPLHGIDLRLSPIEEAEARLREMQSTTPTFSISWPVG